MKPQLFIAIMLCLLLFGACSQQTIREDTSMPVDEPATSQINDSLESFKVEEKRLLALLEQDPDHVETNVSLAGLYYRLALEQIKIVDQQKYQTLLSDPNAYDFPLEVFFYTLDLEDFEGKTFVLFSRALQYYEHAYALDSTNTAIYGPLADCYKLLRQDGKFKNMEKKIAGE